MHLKVFAEVILLCHFIHSLSYEDIYILGNLKLH